MSEQERGLPSNQQDEAQEAAAARGEETEEQDESTDETRVPARAKAGVPAKRKLTREEILQYIRRITTAQEAGSTPTVVKVLYDPANLALVTETPPRMVVPLVRMKLLLAATDPDRKISLIEVFIQEFDRRMVSYKRKGRLEMLGALQAIAESEGQEEVPLS